MCGMYWIWISVVWVCFFLILNHWLFLYFQVDIPVVSPDCASIEVYKTPEGQVKFRMLKDTEINKLMADATPKEGEEATGST